MAGFGSLVPYGAPFGVMSPADQAEADAASGVNKVGVGLLNALTGIPKALIDKAAADAAFTYGQAPVKTEADAASANQARSDLAGESAATMFGVGGASIPFSFMRGGAEAGVFGGRLAKTADHEKLAAAEKMAAEGKFPDEIHAQTGWFQGPDKQWRFEIPDQDMAFKRIVNPGTIDNWPIDVPGKQSTLGGAINHPELFKAYPDLADVPFGIGSQSNKHLAAYRPRDPILDGLGKPESIELTALPSRYGDENKLAARSSTMHEVQHAIQHREGFARGGNPSSFASDKLGAEQMIEGVNDTLSSLAKQMNGVTDPVKKAELKAGYDRLMDYKLKELVPQAQIDPMAAYKRLAGETEARNVQTRLDWDTQKRSDIPPSFSQDIPNDQQIVRTVGPFGSLAPQMSAKPSLDWSPGGGSKTAKIGDTSIDYGIAKDGKSGEIILVKTPVHAQGKGAARNAMNAMIEKADDAGTTLFLNSDPMGKGMSKTQLDRFYQSLGFVKNMGRNKDFTSRAEYVRQPKTKGE